MNIRKEVPLMTPEAIKKLAKGVAIVSVLCGAYGMALCLPYAFSSHLSVITSASFYFICGAVLIAAGLISFSVLI